METINALKHRHFNNAFDNDDQDNNNTPTVSLFSPETLVDAAIRSPFGNAFMADHRTSNASTGHHRKSTSTNSQYSLGTAKKTHSGFSSLKTILSAWAVFLGFLALIVMVMFQIHYTLPVPVYEGQDPVTGKLQFSEENVRVVVRHMTRDIGYRVVGTEQELETKNYLIKELAALKDQARLESLRGAQDLPNFDMWVQVGDGSHRFDFMSKGSSSITIQFCLFPFIHQHPSSSSSCFLIRIMGRLPHELSLFFFSSFPPPDGTVTQW